ILLEPLGTGSYAEVRLAKEKTSNTLYAVKIMNKDFLKKRQVGKEETFMDSIKREIAIMKKVHHPNVLRLYEVMDDPKVNKLYLVLEYCKKGDLMNILNGDTRTVTCDPMNDTDVWYIMRQIVQGLSFLHLQNIVHGDIKPQNLLVGSDNVAKIADFGISKFVQGSNQRLQEQAGTPTFMSPELCYGEGYSGQLADVWALGATMYMIRCGKPPFMANQVMVLYEKIQNDPLDFPTEVNMSPGLRRLLRAMMEKDPAKRITLDQVLADRWLQQGDYGPARTTTAGGVRTDVTAAPAAGAVNPSSHGMPSTASSNIPGGGDTGGNPTGIPRNRNIISSNGGPANGGGGGVGLGLRPPPSLSFLPLTDQGYRAIKVSDDEVHKSINQGITTGGNSGPGSAAGGGSSPVTQQRGTTAANSSTPPILEESAATSTTTSPALAGGSGGNSASPAISPSGGAGIGGVRRGEGGGSRNSGGNSSNRGHLSETEESWKFRSFKKKIEENASDPKFRGAAIASPAGEARPRQAPAAQNGSAGRPPDPTAEKSYLSSTTNTPKAATATGATPSPPSSLPPRSAAASQQHHHPHKQQQHARGHEVTAPAPSGDSFFDDTDEDDDHDEDDSDDFSSEDNPDTLYDGSGSVSTASPRSATAMSPSSSSRATSSPAEPGRGESRPSVGQYRGGGSSARGRGKGGGVGMRGGGPMRQHQAGGRRPSAKRRSSEKFDAVMDTLAAQPPYGGGRGGGAASRRTGPGGTGSGGDGDGDDRSRTPYGSVRPLRDLSLRGVKVRSSARGPAATGSPPPSQAPGESRCNPRLGLVAAVSQRQGKRASQEDRATVA
ncbi:unnamed protein product, partial [Ectocarpus sp. 8 AP-2014]